MQETLVHSWVRKIPWRRDRLPTPVFLGFPGGSAGKESACKGYSLQYSGLENSMDCRVHGVTKSRTELSNFHFKRDGLDRVVGTTQGCYKAGLELCSQEQCLGLLQGGHGLLADTPPTLQNTASTPDR